MVDHLKASLHVWIEVLRVSHDHLAELATSTPGATDQRGGVWAAEPILDRWATTYQIASALRQCARRIEALRSSGTLSDDATSSADQFLTVYECEDLKDLRDVIEHSDEYQTGGGQKKGLAPLIEGWMPGAHPTPAPAASVSAIRMFGRDYRIAGAMSAVKRLAEHL